MGRPSFVMLGLGLLGLHEIGASGWRWLAVDVGWAVLGGLAVGGGSGRWWGGWCSTCAARIKRRSGWTIFWCWA